MFSNNTSSFKRNTIIITILFCFSSILIPNAYATGEIAWGTIASSPASYDISLQRVTGPPITFELLDNDKNGDPQNEQATARIFSTVDATGTTFTLTENIVNNGRFQSSKIIFMTTNLVFQTTDTIIVTIEDRCDDGVGGGPGSGMTGNCDPAAIDTLTGGGMDGATAISDSDSLTLVPIHLTETGPNTSTFVGRLQLTTGNSVINPAPGISQLKVAPGDIVAIIDDVTTMATNAMIAPIPSDRGALLVSIGKTATVIATLEDATVVSDSVTIVNTSPGRGGGGLVVPSLVVDAVAPAASGGSGSGCKGDCTPPTLGIDDRYNRIVMDGFSYNDHAVDVDLYYTHYPLVTVNVGQQNKATLKIYDNSGPQYIEHIELAFGLGKDQILDKSNAAISIDMSHEGEMLVSKNDPENVLQDIRVEKTAGSCSINVRADCLIITIYHTFRAPLDFNIVATDVWDFNRNSWQNYYNDGVEVKGDSLNPPKQYVAIDKGYPITITEIDKNKAIDDYGNTWTFDKEWKKDYTPPQKIDEGPTSHGYDRNHVRFETYRLEQISIAQEQLEKILHGKSIQKTLSDSFSHNSNYISRSEDNDLKLRIINEITKAEQLIQKALR